MLIKVRWPRTIGAIAALFIIGMIFLALDSFSLHYFRLWLAGGEQCIIFAPDGSRETRYGDACDQ
jgi:hypothetical protein